MTTITPWWEMEEFEKAFLGSPFGSFFDTPAFAQFRTDVTDEGDHYLLEADLPGFKKKDKKDNVYGSYTRSFDISGVDADKIKAKYVDGVLRLPESRRMEIE